MLPSFFTWTAAVLFALLPALFWLFIWYRQDSAQPEPKSIVFKAFIFGMMGILPFFGIQLMIEHSPDLLLVWNVLSQKYFFLSTIFLTLLLASTEELVKHFSVLNLGRNLDIYFDQIVDGIIYSVSAALGFAFMENVLYFAHALIFAGVSSEFWKIFIFRSFGTMLAHTIFSGIFGFFWGYAVFALHASGAKSRIKSVQSFWDTLQFKIIFQQIVKKHPTRKKASSDRDLMREAFLFATVLHVAFNLFLVFEIFGKKLTPLVAPILLFGFLYLSHQFLVKRNIRIWKPVGA